MQRMQALHDILDEHRCAVSFSVPILIAVLELRIYMSSSLRAKVSAMPRSFAGFRSVFSSKEEKAGGWAAG